jgi:serine/threonine protein kinase
MYIYFFIFLSFLFYYREIIMDYSKMIIQNFMTNKINNIYKISLNIDYDTFLNRYKKNENINFIINKYDKDNLLIEQTTFINQKFIGQGTYSKVFKIKKELTDEYFIIKLGITYPDVTLDEAKNIIKIFNYDGISNSLKYDINSYGMNDIIKNTNTDGTINYKNVSFIIMPYFSDYDMYQYQHFIDKNQINSKIKLYIKKLPILLNKIIGNLIELNKYFNHNDIKSDNIIINLDDNTVKIIDYGLCSKIDEVYTTLGYRQISPEYILNKFDKSYIISNQQSYKIDNFGLFWLILDVFTNEKLFNKYIKLPLKNHSDESFKSTLNFYLNINNINKNNLSAKIKKELVDFTHKNIKNEFIEDTYNFTNSYIKDNLFSDKNEFYCFIENMLCLIKFDPLQRMDLSDFIKNSFFSK